MLAIYSNETLTSQTFYGSNGNNAIKSGAAQDFMLGQDGSDRLDLGEGDDVALGGRGNDTLLGRGGSDLLIGARGNDLIKGGTGADLLSGNLGRDDLRGGRDSDLLLDGLGDDVLYGNKGNDVFIFIDEAMLGADGATTEFFYGGRGADVLHLFLTENSISQLNNTGSVLTFGNTTINIDSINEVFVHDGMPAEASDLGLTDDLAARFDEAQLWGIV